MLGRGWGSLAPSKPERGFRMFCKTTRNCLRTITVCSIIMGAVCLVLSFMIVSQMRYERQEHEKRIGIMIDQYMLVVESAEKIESDYLKKFHKMNWKAKP